MIRIMLYCAGLAACVAVSLTALETSRNLRAAAAARSAPLTTIVMPKPTISPALLEFDRPYCGFYDNQKILPKDD
jgi:hypothetical protein